MDIHHIVFVEDGGQDVYENLIALCPNCHRLVHDGKIDKKSLRIYKANLQYLHDKYSNAEMDILFDLATKPLGHGLPWTPHLTILIKRALDSGLLELHDPGARVFMANVRANPVYVLITPKGRQFVSDLGEREL